MKKRYGFNSPKGEANNAAQKQRSATVSPITKHAIPPIAVPLKPVIGESTDKGKKS